MSPGCTKRSSRFFQQHLVEASSTFPGRRKNCAGRSSPPARCWRSAPTAEGAFLRVRGEPEAVERLREQLGEAGTIRARS